MLKTRTLTGLFLLCLASNIPAQAPRIFSSQDARFMLEQIAEGLTTPWGMCFLSPTTLIITEREGLIKLLNVSTGTITPLAGIPEVMAEWQGGILDVAVPPDFKRGDWIYFTFVRDNDGQGVTVLARAKLNRQRLVSWQDLLVTRSATDTTYHFGSRIAFREDYVFFTVGDRGIRANGQDLSNHAGGVLRIRRDGRIPANNPFVKTPGAQPEIWSYGHRNPQGLAYDRIHKRLWLIEHGPRGGDEINLVLAGRNYGWPIISYGKEYWGPLAVGEGTEREGMEQPVKQYTPSIAPSSLMIYSGNAFPAWRGNLFSGALVLGHINRVMLDHNANAVGEERLLKELNERIRALIEDPQGWIYFSTDSGKIYRIRPAGEQLPERSDR